MKVSKVDKNRIDKKIYYLYIALRMRNLILTLLFIPLVFSCTTDKDEVFVGRIREDNSYKNSVNLWIVSDNLRKGAAKNAIQIAEKAYLNGLLKF